MEGEKRNQTGRLQKLVPPYPLQVQYCFQGSEKWQETSLTLEVTAPDKIAVLFYSCSLKSGLGTYAKELKQAWKSTSSLTSSESFGSGLVVDETPADCCEYGTDVLLILSTTKGVKLHRRIYSTHKCKRLQFFPDTLLPRHIGWCNNKKFDEPGIKMEIFILDQGNCETILVAVAAVSSPSFPHNFSFL